MHLGGTVYTKPIIITVGIRLIMRPVRGALSKPKTPNRRTLVIVMCRNVLNPGLPLVRMDYSITETTQNTIAFHGRVGTGQAYPDMFQDRWVVLKVNWAFQIFTLQTMFVEIQQTIKTAHGVWPEIGPYIVI